MKSVTLIATISMMGWCDSLGDGCLPRYAEGDSDLASSSIGESGMTGPATPTTGGASTESTGEASTASISVASTATTGEPPPDAVALQLSFSQVKQFNFIWSAAPGAEYYQLLERTTPDTDYEKLGDDIVGESISLMLPLHLRFGASYILRACNGGGCTNSEPVDVVDSMVAAVGYFKASNTDANDVFGWKVALSADGNTLAVGAGEENSDAIVIDGDQTDNSAVNAGAVYVFVRSNNVWSQEAYLKAPNADAEDNFGKSIAVSADGKVIVVGAYLEDSNAVGIGGDQADNSAENSGAVYVFMRSKDAWSQQGYLKASNADAGDCFGADIAISADGSTIAVGASGEDSNASGIDGNQADNSAPYAGAVYVFVRLDNDWSQQAYIKASNTDEGDHFSAVALSGDGSTLVVGAQGASSVGGVGVGGSQEDDSAYFAGAVYVFVRSDNVWSQQAYVKASNVGAFESFGVSVAVSVDGNTLVVGAHLEDSAAVGVGGNQADNSIDDAGAVYVFVRSSNAWSQQAYIKASKSSTENYFGASVAVSGDGNTLVVGAFGEASAAAGIDGDQPDKSAENSGAVYVFVRSNNVWSQQAYVKASNTDAGDEFGASVAVSADGKTLAVGAFGEGSAAPGIGGDQADNSVFRAGAVYLY